MIHFNGSKCLSLRPDETHAITYCQYHLQWVVNDIVFLAVRGSYQIIFNNWIFVQLLVFQNVYDMIGDVSHRGPKKVRNLNHRDRFYDSLQRFKVPIPDILAPSTAFPNINGLSITYAIWFDTTSTQCKDSNKVLTNIILTKNFITILLCPS